jgi:hypothetical protein
MSEETVLKGSKACMWAIRLTSAGAIFLIVSYLGAKVGLSPMLAMLGITFAVLAFVSGAICAATGLIRSGGSAGGRSAPLTWAALAAGIAAIAGTSMSMSGGGGAPIHDISTDLENPPEFIAVAKLRGPGDNPAEYTGDDTADLQRAAYPDIETIVLRDPTPFVFEQALAVARNMGWQIVTEDADAYRIEATATTPFVGFKDDVVIRISTNNGETLVDVRSKSRLGRGDMGVNANRIRQFRDNLVAAVEP